MNSPIVQVSRWKMELGNKSRGLFEVVKTLSDLGRDSTCPRHKENQVYHEIYQVDKQVNIYILNFSSKQKYISAMKSSNYCIFKHQNCQIIIGQ
jgi:hypothetical protein